MAAHSSNASAGFPCSKVIGASGRVTSVKESAALSCHSEFFIPNFSIFEDACEGLAAALIPGSELALSLHAYSRRGPLSIDRPFLTSARPL